MNSKPVFVITGATGSGKTTVANYLQKKYDFARVVTHTTRAPRAGEVDGVDYYFETPESMTKLRLLERVDYDHHLYGSSVEGLERGWHHHPADVIVLDTAGALTYHQQLEGRAVIIFLTVRHLAALAARIRQRGDQEQAIASRLASKEYQRDLILPGALTGIAHVIENDDWAQTARQLDRLVAQTLPAARKV